MALKKRVPVLATHRTRDTHGQRGAPDPRAGFVLLLAVMLLAFMTAFLIGLAALTKAEVGASSVRLRSAQARENAVLGLTVALAQLQRSAGPDQRVSATAASRANTAHPHWTGIWDAVTSDPDPFIWLVSGSEFETGRTQPATPLDGGAGVEMYRTGRIGDDAMIFAPIVTIGDDEAEGRSAPAGHYAWWVGDEGVKASVAAPVTSLASLGLSNLSPEQQRRWHQAAAVGASPVANEFAPAVDSRQPSNAILVDAARFLAFEQLVHLRATDGVRLGRETAAREALAWTPDHRNVLADSRRGGLRQDLSLQPELLGRAFAAWADCSSYLEPTTASVDPSHSILPAYGADPLRRRHRIVAPVRDAGLVFSTAPVLTSFFLQFNVRRVGGNSAPAATSAIEVRARLVVQFWNPWTTALVPQPLRLTVAGLPDLTLIDSNGGRQIIPLQERFGSPMVINLPADDVAFPGDPDDHSWLPGRVYAWRTRGGTPGDWQTEFYNRTLSVANANLWVVPAGISYLPPTSNAVLLSVAGAGSQLTLQLQQADGTLLTEIRSPNYAAFSTTPQRTNNNDEYRFGFALRLIDPVDFAAAPQGSEWLVGEGGDPRSLATGEPLYRTGSGGDLPSAYVGVGGNAVLTDENRLLDRVMGRSGMSYNEDVPVFELPRQPLLSIGQLQHVQIEGARAFGIGNPWSALRLVNGIPAADLFDRFFFSGLAPETIAPDRDRVALLSPLLQVQPANPAGAAAVTRTSFAASAAARSSAFLLQGGAFNVNSLHVEAWAAVLRSTRLVAGETFTFLEPSGSSGTAGDDKLGHADEPGAVYFRFSQSAQETYRADPGYAASSAVPPASPTISSTANTHFYRQGRRTLTAEEVNALATAIAAASQIRQRDRGPWRGLAEFVSPEDSLGGSSLLEHAIAAAGLNSRVTEFSSQWLTPADLLTSLAPVLFTRSDTFRVRSYGDAVNPVSGAIESRMWCEAVVQRMPSYFDPVDAPEVLPPDLSALNRSLGRRFEIVSFRWLNRTDL